MANTSGSTSLSFVLHLIEYLLLYLIYLGPCGFGGLVRSRSSMPSLSLAISALSGATSSCIFLAYSGSLTQLVVRKLFDRLVLCLYILYLRHDFLEVTL